MKLLRRRQRRYIRGNFSLNGRKASVIHCHTMRIAMATTTAPTVMVESTEHSIPAVTLTIIPPSRPQTPQSGHQIGNNAVDSLPSPSSSNLSPVFLSRPGSISEASDDGIYSCATSVTNLSITDEEYDARSTVYHIYHAGKRDSNFTVHTIKDTELVQQLCEEVGPVVLRRFCCPSKNKLVRRLRSSDSPEPKKIKADDRKTDPRKATYYLHSPFLWFHEPPQTLRFGSDKNAPVVCLIEGSFFWRTWRLDFVIIEDEGKKKGKAKEQEKPKTSQRVDSGFCEGEDERGDATNKETERRWKGLNEPGVIDPRGVLASKYPLRARRIGETGKEYVIEQIKRQKSLPVTPEQVANRINRSTSFSEKARVLFRSRTLSAGSITAAPPPTPDPELSDSMLPAGPKPEDLPDHLKPDSLDEGSILLKWSGWLTREYEFAYKGIDLRWKGTGTVKDEKKFLGPWSKFNHLKLVALLPEDDGEDKGEQRDNKGLDAKEQGLKRRGSFASFVSLMSRRDSAISVTQSEKQKVEYKVKGGKQVVIAKYTCLAAVRKAGRLTIYDYGLERATGAHVKPGKESDFGTEKERLRHLVVATALCMLQGEKEKRDTIIEIIATLAGAAG